MAKIDFDKILSNPNARIIIEGSETWVITGFIIDDVRIGGRANWSAGRQPLLLGTITEGLAGVKKYLEAFNAARTKQFRLESVLGSQLGWSGSENLQITLNLMFFARRPGDDVRLKARQLYEAVYPSIPQGVSTWTTKLFPPRGYKTGNVNDTIGGFSLRIGQWFHISKRIMVISDVDFTYSKETIAGGYPLYATGAVTLQASRIISAEEMNSFLR
jgi:hypothetical protein